MGGFGIQILVAKGFMEQRPHGQALKHHSVRPYRETDDKNANQGTESQPSPNSPGPGEPPGPTGSHRVPPEGDPDPVGPGSRRHG